MGAVFELDHGGIAADPRFGIMVRELSGQSKIDSRASFNRYCRDACRLWDEHFGHGHGKTSSLFADLLRRVERRGDGVIQTPWGGVVITLHEHPRVNKYLVVRKGGYLALETHEEKDECLEVQEGSGLILSRRASDQPLTVQVLEPGDQFHFEPGMEHCLIGTENLLVFERSIDPKGMDQDLVFIYEPDGSEPETDSVVTTAKGEA
jgi:mannose-6-phosphate isomerase-like protein (cupin superfamily)